MGTSSINLSSGLVPKPGGIDLSAGMVAAPSTGRLNMPMHQAEAIQHQNAPISATSNASKVSALHTVLSTSGMAVGGMFGGVDGAGLGAAGGEFAAEKIAGEKTDSAKIAKAAITGGLNEAGGQAVTKGIGKAAEAMAPKLSERTSLLIDRLIKSSVRKPIPGTKSKVESADAIAKEVSKVAGNAKSLKELYQNVEKGISDLTENTHSIVDKYKPQWVEAEASPFEGRAGKSTSSEISSTRALGSGQKALSSGAPSLPEPSDLAVAGKASLGPAEPIGNTARAVPSSADSAADTAPKVKVFVRSGGIPLRQILMRSARKTAQELSETEVPNKEKAVLRLAHMIRAHAGKDELTPSEALELRRWLYSKVKWPRAALGMRDDIYHALNGQIETFLEPQDAATFRANNASVSKLIRGRDAIDVRELAHRRSGIHLSHRWWILPLVGSGVGGGLGYAAGGYKGMAEGTALGAGLGEAASIGSGMAESAGGLLMRARADKAMAEAAARIGSHADNPVVRRAIQAGVMAGIQNVSGQP